MLRAVLVFGLLAALGGIILAGPTQALTIERAVLVQRHGVRPPTSPNSALLRYSAQPWPAWPVPPGDLTEHGAKVVALMGASLREDLTGAGLLPRTGCPAPGSVRVWADGTDERTRRSGETLGASLAPGCGLQARWAAAELRDPIFGGSHDPACRAGAKTAKADLLAAVGPAGFGPPATRASLDHLQAVLAPKACAGGPGLCLSGPNQVEMTSQGPRGVGPLFTAASLSEDILLEYAEGMPLDEVGWGKVRSAADVAAIMGAHGRFYQVLEKDRDLSARIGAPMARLILAALSGQAGALTGPEVHVLALAGHDDNIAVEGSIFRIAPWTLPGQPDTVSPAQTLVFLLLNDHGRRFVRAV
ncbi:MAG: histidine-type phosphatase, partial [Caulobacteraceae bacterium]